MIIGIDFDGTCVTHEYPKVGQDIGAIPILKALTDNGHQLILFTMRSYTDIPIENNNTISTLQMAINWFNDNDIPLWGINENPEQKDWTSSPKPYCHLYIDDAGFNMPLKYNYNGNKSRPFVDWFTVSLGLMFKGLLKASQVPIK